MYDIFSCDPVDTDIHQVFLLLPVITRDTVQGINMSIKRLGNDA